MAEPSDGIRLQRVMAQAGVGSRRHCEELIEAGRVSVDGRVVRVQGLRVDPARAVIAVDGVRLASAPGLEHLLLNKPRGVLTTMADDRGRPCVGDYVADRRARLFHVGRLDADSEGLLLLTNDGDLAHRMTHPAYGIAKTYLATVHGVPARDVGRRLRAGVELEDGPVRVDSFRVLESEGKRALVEVVVHEGRKHLVRRLLDEVGLPVDRLLRTAIGPLTIGNHKPGRLRHLTQPEVGMLYRAVGL